MLVVGLILAIGTCLGFTFGAGDIKGEFLQWGPIKSEVYVTPHRDCFHRRGVL